MSKFSSTLGFLENAPTYFTRILLSRFPRRSGLFSFGPKTQHGAKGSFVSRLLNRHFVKTTPDLNAQPLRNSLFPGRKPDWYLADRSVRIAMENEDDVRTTFDIYAMGHYDRINGNARSGSVVWDIGANIGVASLIFAQNPHVIHVYAYEPLPHTFECAQRTLAANKALSRKISIENEGIGSSELETKLSFALKAKAAVGIAGIPDRIKEMYQIKPEDIEEVTIRLSDAARVLRAIRKHHPDAPILLKMDAEGAEYGILDRLIEEELLSEIDSAAIEWHNLPGEDYLTSRLRANGFHCQTKSLEPDGSIGMIDAWR